MYIRLKAKLIEFTNLDPRLIEYTPRLIEYQPWYTPLTLIRPRDPGSPGSLIRPNKGGENLFM